MVEICIFFQCDGMYHLPCISAILLSYQFTVGVANAEAYQDQAIRLMSEVGQV